MRSWDAGQFNFYILGWISEQRSHFDLVFPPYWSHRNPTDSIKEGELNLWLAAVIYSRGTKRSCNNSIQTSSLPKHSKPIIPQDLHHYLRKRLLTKGFTKPTRFQLSLNDWHCVWVPNTGGALGAGKKFNWLIAQSLLARQTWWCKQVVCSMSCISAGESAGHPKSSPSHWLRSPLKELAWTSLGH